LTPCWRLLIGEQHKVGATTSIAVPLQHWVRASEAAHVKVADLDLNAASVKICGKGGKQRFCPLWPATVSALARIIAGGEPSRPLFLNRCGRPITRFGIHTAIERNALKARALLPMLVAKRVSPH
jgi:integrase/recombinase XerD